MFLVFAVFVVVVVVAVFACCCCWLLLFGFVAAAVADGAVVSVDCSAAVFTLADLLLYWPSAFVVGRWRDLSANCCKLTSPLPNYSNFQLHSPTTTDITIVLPDLLLYTTGDTCLPPSVDYHHIQTPTNHGFIAFLTFGICCRLA